MAQHIRTLQYGIPRRRGNPYGIREIPLEMRRGFHYGRPSYALPNGYSPDVLNLVPAVDDIGITPRDGYTTFDTYSALTTPEVVTQLFDTDGVPAIAALAGNEIHYYPYSNPGFSTLSRLGQPLSNATSAHAEIIQANSATTAYAIVLNATNAPKKFTVEQDTQTWSDLTTFYSIASVAYTGAMSDERLVLATIESLDAQYPHRLAWSVRGSPTDFTLALGAGFADLTEMRGGILRLVPDTQGFLILGGGEIWRARPRRDIYAFDFIPIVREVGCPFPNTAVASPHGTIFIGNDYEPYALTGSQLRPLGKASDTENHSRIKRYFRRYISDPNFVWANYDYNLQRYHVHFNATRGVTYDFNTDSWWPFEFTSTVGWRGCMVIAPDSTIDLGLTWNQQDIAWDILGNPWNDEGVVRQPFESAHPLLVSDLGTPYSWRSIALTDLTSTFTSTWASRRVSNTARRFFIDGSWVEFSSKTASTLTVSHIFDDYTSTQTISLQSSTLSTAWAPAHGNARACAINIAVDSTARPQLTAAVIGARVERGIGGAR
jgi:hypothetical protein